MELPSAEDLVYSRSRPIAAGDSGTQPALVRLGQLAALPLYALGAGVLRLWRGRSPQISGAVSPGERWAMHHDLGHRLQALRATGTPFQLRDTIPFSWTRVGVFGPLEDVRVHFPAADQRIVDLLQSGDSHVVVLERAPAALVYIVFGPADDVPGASDVCIATDRIVVSRVNRDCVDYLQFTAAEAPATAA